jgi:tetrathionate reductase subunit B
MEPTMTPRTEDAAVVGPTISRRRLLTTGAAVLGGVVGSRILSAWLLPFDEPVRAAADLSPITARYDPSSHRWAFVVDTTECIGCGHCVEACKRENHVPVETEYNRTWVERHVVNPDGTVTVSSPDGGIHGFPPGTTDDMAEARPAYFVPRLCMQCEDPPCVAACPVSATYKTEDGVVLVDEQRCIGCGYCVVACPYGARYIVPSGGEMPKGVPGVADKCTFCYHRITRGELPACVEVCPTSARKFGDANDPTSAVSVILSEGHTQVLKAELGTKPRVHYLGLEAEVS